MREYIIGVDLGGTSIKFGKFDLDGMLIEKWSIRTNKNDNGDFIIREIGNSIKEHVEVSKILGIGFGVPGPVKNNVVLHCVNIGWGRKDIELEMHYILNDDQIVIKVANDANAAAAGEMYKGVAQGYKSLVMFTLGTGVGGGLIIDGKLIEGVHGAGGELGHIVVDTQHKFKCNCGKRGCLETVASATGIVRLAKHYLSTSKEPTPLRKFFNFSAKKVIDFAKDGDPFCVKVIDESMAYLAMELSAICLSVDPEIVVIGGGISNAGEFIIEKLEKHFLEDIYPFILESNIKLASLGNDAGIYGCAYLIK